MDLMYAFKKNQIDAESKLKRAKIKQVRDVEDKKKKPKTVTPKTPTKNKVTPKTQTKNKVTKVSRGDRKKPTTKTPTTKTPTPKTQAMQLQTAQNNILEKAKNRKVKGKIKPTTAKLYRRNNPNDPDVKAYNAIMKARGKL